MFDQLILVLAFAAMMVVLAKRLWRHDVVALATLVTIALILSIPPQEALKGFGHPAVFLVASVFIIGRGISNSGLVDLCAYWLYRISSYPFLQLIALTTMATVLSGFINNTGVLALFLPVAIKIARTSSRPASFFLMPLAFSTLFGGLITLTGTPSNIIVATYRAETALGPFGYFSFTSVGLYMSLLGLLYLWLVGWGLLPKRQNSEDDSPVYTEYMTEVIVPEGSSFVGKTAQDIHNYFSNHIEVYAILKEGSRRTRLAQLMPIKALRQRLTPNKFRPPDDDTIQADDLLLIKGNADVIQTIINSGKLVLTEQKELPLREHSRIGEIVIIPNSHLEGKSVQALNLRSEYELNLLAVSRRDYRFYHHIDEVVLQSGDVLLVQGHKATFDYVINQLGCLPLATRDLRLGYPRRILTVVIILFGAIAFSALNIIPTTTAFISAALVMGLTRLVSLQDAYESIDLPSLVTLGALISITSIFQQAGLIESMSSLLLSATHIVSPTIAVGTILTAAMLLSNVIDNAAVAVFLAPLSIQTAQFFQASPDPFLMSVAVGSVAAFITPFGEQPNLLVMSVGNYTFKDYLKLGIPLSILFAFLGTTVILKFWPLY